MGLAALLIPGIGPLVAFGALGAALTGVVAGAVVGSITAALINFSGTPEEDARRYESEVQAGNTLVAVKVSAGADDLERPPAPSADQQGGVGATGRDTNLPDGGDWTACHRGRSGHRAARFNSFRCDRCGLCGKESAAQNIIL